MFAVATHGVAHAARPWLAANAAEELTFSGHHALRPGHRRTGELDVSPPYSTAVTAKARFVQLHARPRARAGAVWRLPLAPPADSPGEGECGFSGARRGGGARARGLKAGRRRPARGRIIGRRVAVLAPRKKWLGALAAALRTVELPAQLHADNRARGAEPARAWLGALLGVLADPAR